MQALVGSLVSDIVQASSDGDADHAAFVVPEIAPTKVQGVRAKKSSVYVERKETVAELYVSVICVAPLERYMYWLFRIQREQAWLSQTVAKRPLMQLTSMSRSPVASALSETTDVLCRFSPAGSSLLGHLEGSWAGIISQQTI